jgi:hypothetical protein
MLTTKTLQIRALLFLILLSATTHLAILLFVAILRSQPDALNVFNILGISLIFPALETGAGNSVLGLLMLTIVWTGIFYTLKRHAKARTLPQKENK